MADSWDYATAKTPAERGVALAFLTADVAAVGVDALDLGAGGGVAALAVARGGIKAAQVGTKLAEGGHVANIALHAVKEGTENIASSGDSKRGSSGANGNSSSATSTESGTTSESAQKTRQKSQSEANAHSSGGSYSNLQDGPTVGSGKDFTRTQKRKILEQNKAQNNGQLTSDKSGEVLGPGQQSRKGVTPPANEAHVDHMVPKSKGGSNSYSNAQVLSRKENLQKGAKVEEKANE